MLNIHTFVAENHIKRIIYSIKNLRVNMSKYKELLDHLNKNSFRKQASYNVNVGFHSLFKKENGVLLYNETLNAAKDVKSYGGVEITKRITPLFQRKNTKWSIKMQQSFIQNLLSGCNSTIQLFQIKGNDEECPILDGLQRLTSIASFQNDDFPIFDNIYWSDIKSDFRERIHLNLSIYKFDNEIEVVEYYIQMNEGITHSESDIKVAYDYLKQITANKATC